MKGDEFSLKTTELSIEKVKKLNEKNLQDQLKRGSYQPMTGFQKKRDEFAQKGLENLERLTMKRNELVEKMAPMKSQMQTNATAINNINNSNTTNAVGGKRGVLNGEIIQKALPYLLRTTN